VHELHEQQETRGKRGMVKDTVKIIEADLDTQEKILKGLYNQRKALRKEITTLIAQTKEARKEMMRFPSKDPKNVKRTAEEFVFNYGWKLKD